MNSKTLVISLTLLLILSGAAVLLTRNGNLATPNCRVVSASELSNPGAMTFDPNSVCCDERMIEECSLPNANSSFLNYTIEFGHAADVRALLEHGAKADRMLPMGSPIIVAARRGDMEIVELVLKRTPSSFLYDGARFALRSGELQTTKALVHALPAEERVANCSKLACTASEELIQPGASFERLSRIILFLIHDCVDANAFCEAETILSSYARRDDNLPFVEALLERGADLNKPERGGKTVKEYLQSFSDYQSRPRIAAVIEGTAKAW